MNEPQKSLHEWLLWKRFDANWEGLPCTNLLIYHNRPSLHAAPRDPRHVRTVQALIFMNASLAWVKNAVGRSWVEPEALVLFRKYKEWECAEPAKKSERAAFLRARAYRAAVGHLLDLQTRYRAGYQWARTMREEFGLSGGEMHRGYGRGPCTRKIYKVRRRAVLDGW